MSPAKSSTYGNQSFHVSSSKWFRVFEIDSYKSRDYFALKNRNVYTSHYYSHSAFSLIDISIAKNKPLFVFRVSSTNITPTKKTLEA